MHNESNTSVEVQIWYPVKQHLTDQYSIRSAGCPVGVCVVIEGQLIAQRLSSIDSKKKQPVGLLHAAAGESECAACLVLVCPEPQ